MPNIVDDTLNRVLDSIVDTIPKCVEKFAGFFGYPDNPGMIWKYSKAMKKAHRAYIENLPKREMSFPPNPTPNNMIEVLFGSFPKGNIIERYYFENNKEGFYNFYIQNYGDMKFLPDWLSEFIQIKLNFCLDITALIYAQEILFVLMVIYYYIVVVRIMLFWFLIINPYTWPWWPFVFFVDWTEDVMSGFVPTVAGLNLTTSLFMAMLGSIADTCNNLIFTMPFLPSEAEKIIKMKNDEPQEFLVFHYLPALWYKHPIPNQLREFWYNDRPDILKYMQETYKGLGIQFLPDEVVEKMNISMMLKPEEPVILNDNIVSSIVQFLDKSLLYNDFLHDFVITHIDKLA